MDDETEPEKSPLQPRFAAAADFRAMDFEVPIRDSNLAYAHDTYGRYERAFAAPRAASDDAGRLVYRLLTRRMPMRFVEQS